MVSLAIIAPNNWCLVFNACCIDELLFNLTNLALEELAANKGMQVTLEIDYVFSKRILVNQFNSVILLFL
jgi:hypothetical protein